MAVSPAIIPRKDFCVTRAGFGVVPKWGVFPPLFAAASASFLLAAVRVVTVVVKARLAAMSCWRVAASFVAANARLSSANSSQSIAGGP
jgi:hypothetical protein